MKTLEQKRQYWREYMRKYNATPKGAAYNRKHIKDYRKKNPGKPHDNRPGRTNEYRQILLNTLIERDGFSCGICGKSLENSKIHLDHIIPVALNGPHILSNIRLAHAYCNLKDTNLIRKQKAGY